MPTEPKISKDIILKSALELLETIDLEDLTARQLAERIGCSVQPIYYNFATMDELRRAVINAIHNLYQEYMCAGAAQPKPYQSMGMAYIRFARDYPNYFKILFMRQTDRTVENIIDDDSTKNHVIEAGMELTGFDYDRQRQFHLQVWIFTHGLASLVATSTINISDYEIEHLLHKAVHEMIVGARKEHNE